MLGSKKSGFGISGHTTLVSRETVIVGDIHFSGNLDIEGLVQGSIVALPDKEAFVRVIQEGCVEGEIRVPRVVINGTVKGVVYATKHLEMATHGRVHGDVFYARVEMAAGSEVNGVLKHISEQNQEGGEPSPGVAEPGEANSGVSQAATSQPGTAGRKVD